MTQQQIPDSLLKRLSPLSELDEAARSGLAACARLEKAAPGYKINAADEQAWLVYLVSGTLNIVSRGMPEAVAGGSARGLEPLFGDRPGNDFAVTESGCVLLHIDREACARLLTEARTAGFEVDDVETSSDEMDIFQGIYEACVGKKLQLPPMPEVAMQIQRMTGDVDIGISELAKVVQMDPAVAGALIHAANSPLYRGSSPIGNVREAIIRLGLNTTRSLASGLSLRQTFKIESPQVRERMARFWEKSVEISAICFVLARRTRLFDPERALLAGIMHNIGIVPILRHVDQHRLDPAPEVLDHTLRKLQTMAGVMVMDYWKMDPDLVAVVEESGNWMRDGGPLPDLCDLVLVARLLDGGHGSDGAEMPPPESAPAFARLGLGEGEEVRAGILAEAQEELAAIRQIMQA